MVREFKLVNEKRQEYSLMDLYNYCFLSDPSGLGYSYSTEYQQIENIFFTNLKKIQQGQITGIVNFVNYDNYRNLIDFIEGSENIRFAYTVPYEKGQQTFYKDVQIQSITKTQKQTNGIISETINFDCLSLWYEEQNVQYKIQTLSNEIRWDFYWNSFFNGTSSNNILYTNKSHADVPIRVIIDGMVQNPTIALYINDQVYQTVEINTAIQEYEKLIYDSRPNYFEITRLKTDGTTESLFNLNIINFENDNVIRIPKNQNTELRISATNSIQNATIIIYPQYKAV